MPMLLDPLLCRQVVAIRVVLPSLCEGAFQCDAEDDEGEGEDVNESVGHAFHEGAVVVVWTCRRHYGLISE